MKTNVRERERERNTVYEETVKTNVGLAERERVTVYECTSHLSNIKTLK